MKNQLRKKATAYGSLLGLLFLTSCDTVKDKLGLSREAPDEFEVMSRAPLEMPPADYNIRPPRPGAPRPQDSTKKVLGIQKTSVSQSSSPKEKSQAEIEFLKEVHAEERNEDIRDLLVEEQTTTPPPPTASFMSTLAKKSAENNETLDPTKEKRIKDTDQA